MLMATLKRTLIVATVVGGFVACTSVSPPLRLADAGRPSDGPDGQVAAGASDAVPSERDANEDGALVDGVRDLAIAGATDSAVAEVASADTPGGCSDTESDPRNCGVCGHDCLAGASCRMGHCQPTAMLESADCPVIFGMDARYLYFANYACTDALRITKDAVRGTPSTIVTGLDRATFIGVMGERLFWNERTGDAGTDYGRSCQLANCSATVSRPFAPDEEVIQFNTVLAPSLAVMGNTPSSGKVRLGWYAVSGGLLAPAAGFSGMVDVGIIRYFFSTGDMAYWIYFPGDEAPTAAAGVLYGKSVSGDMQQPGRLAGGLSMSTVIIDANRRSVLLIDVSGSALYRVPLPLGAGVKPPQLLTAGTEGKTIVAATEDERGVYWLEAAGTLYRCAPDDCSASQTVLAVGQVTTARRLLQDETALYWGTTSPCQIMRLAKQPASAHSAPASN
jgi:hypothetical protein